MPSVISDDRTLVLQRSVEPRLGQSPVGWGVVVLAAVAIVDQLAVALRFARHVAIEDQTILWYAARDWGTGNVHAPNYTGQTYGSTFEAVPTEALRWFGMSPSTALPIVLTLLGLTPWILLGWILLRRERPIAALSAVAVPTVLSTYYSQYTSFYGAGAGRFLASLALVLVIGFPERRMMFVLACALGSFGSAIDASALILVAPVLAYGFLCSPRVERMAAALAGFMPTLLWLFYVNQFYGTHPDYDLHPPPTVLQLNVLRDAIGHPSRYWQMFAPELWRSWAIPFGLAVALVVVLVATRRRRFVVPALTVTVLGLVMLSSDRAAQGPSPLLPNARIFMIVPLTLWFLAYLVAKSEIIRPWRQTYRALVLLVALLGVATVVVRQQTLTERNRALVVAAAHARFVFPVVPVDELDARCQRLSNLARRTRIDLAVFTVDRASAYGCGAALYGEVRTLFPAYERRTWLLHDEARRRRHQLLVVGVGADWCTSVSPIVSSCKLVPLVAPADGSAAIVSFPQQSAISLLRRLGFPVRRFGPGCHPRERRTCSALTERSARTSTV